jgi:hypothetical protein
MNLLPLAAVCLLLAGLAVVLASRFAPPGGARGATGGGRGTQTSRTVRSGAD